MINEEKYGFYRSLIPEYSNLEKAWKVDTKLPINSNEVLIDVEVLNLNAGNFYQLYQSSYGNIQKIKDKIMKITMERGKCHNPVTGTGGILAGKIASMGDKFKKERNFNVGDSIISTSSLIATPLIIEEINDIDLEYGQVYIKGKAILFLKSPLIKNDSKLPLNILLSAIDITGSTSTTYEIINPDDKVIVIGADNLSGLLSSLAAKDKVRLGSGSVNAIVKGKTDEFEDALSIYDNVSYVESYNLKNYLKNNLVKEDYYDVVVNCNSNPLTEIVSCVIVKNGGKIFLPLPTSNTLNSSYSAESISKDCFIIGYKGYSNNDAEYTIGLLEKYKEKISALEKYFKYSIKYDQDKKLKCKETYIPMDDGSQKKYICKSSNISKAVNSAIKVAKYDCNVLIMGESGTGKEMIAKIIHRYSNRSNNPYIRINCAAIPESLMESELFGYEKGAFTGANNKGKKGLWEIAQGGIILLDEIGELPLNLQAKLLRVLQENEFFRIGGTNPIPCDVRVLSITNRDLPKLVEEGKFRKDLFYRLNVFPIEVPPLRNRIRDIPDLVEIFVMEYNKKFGLNKFVNKEAIERMTHYRWNGNIRELENFVQRLLIRSENEEITLEDVQMCKNESYFDDDSCSDNYRAIKDDETFESYIEDIERNLFYKIKNEEKTTRNIAKRLNISQASVVRKLNKYNL